MSLPSSAVRNSPTTAPCWRIKGVQGVWTSWRGPGGSATTGAWGFAPCKTRPDKHAPGPTQTHMTYMIYYGILDDSVMENAVLYDLAILHPKSGELTRQQVAGIQAAGTKVLGYLSVGEDLRTAGLSAEEMRTDPRFTGDGSGPRVAPDGTNLSGSPSPGGTGYASYYLDDNDRDGLPDRNPYFGCAYTNIGDPAWFDVLEGMTLDGADGAAGIREILTTDYGRGLGCDGLFLDTLDTCAPNAYTSDDNPARTRFEWTAAGIIPFLTNIKERYPDKLICQNRGLFFYDPRLPHYRYCPRAFVDDVMFESYRLDSNPNELYHAGYFADNKYQIAPKLLAEAARPDGFTVLSLGYAEGPPAFRLQDSLGEIANEGTELLLADIAEATCMGFSHYLTDGSLTLVNHFVLTHQEPTAPSVPRWSSVFNDSPTWPPRAPSPRVGIGRAEPVKDGTVAVSWDVALHPDGVVYTLYYSDTPFDFALDPRLTTACQQTLLPGMGNGYGEDEYAYPYRATVGGLTPGRRYYFVIRARAACEGGWEETNTVYSTAYLS